MAHLAQFCPVSPGTTALHIAQHRVREKNFARQHGILTPDFWHVTDATSLHHAMDALQGRGVLKTCQLGYDGKGQIWINPGDDLDASFAALGSDDAILEAVVDFAAEASFLVARTADGRIAHFPASLNTHQNGILARSMAPAEINEQLVTSVRWITVNPCPLARLIQPARQALEDGCWPPASPANARLRPPRR